MAFLYVTEFKGLGLGVSAAAGASVMPVPLTPEVVRTRISIDASTSQQTPAFNANTRLVLIHTDLDCHVIIGSTNPVATTTGGRLAANTERFYAVVPSDKIAVIGTTG